MNFSYYTVIFPLYYSLFHFSIVSQHLSKIDVTEQENLSEFIAHFNYYFLDTCDIPAVTQ